MKILLIDDNRELQSYCGCTDIGYVARTYSDGIEKLKSQSWDRLYLDYELNDYKNGLDVLDWLSGHIENIPKEIFVVSNYSAKIIREMNQKIEILMMLKK